MYRIIGTKIGESEISYNFNDTSLFTSISNNPSLNSLKNDFSVWGARTSVSGEELPVHMRYAVDVKPEKYVSISGIIYESSKYDWRELIYQMSLDYYKHNQEDDFYVRLAARNPDTCPNGKTGYETYYTDLQGFWRELYDPNPPEDKKDEYGEDHFIKIRTEDPAALNFWFDFIGEGSSIDKFSIRAIGDRAKVVNDKDVKAIYFKQIPSVLFVTPEEEYIDSGYTRIQISNNLTGFFNISSQGKSAQDVMEELLSQHLFCAESINITAIPIYYLEPNTRIKIKDEKTRIDGEYIISRITLPLAYNGTMQLTATKVVDTIY